MVPKTGRFLIRRLASLIYSVYFKKNVQMHGTVVYRHSERWLSSLTLERDLTFEMDILIPRMNSSIFYSLRWEYVALFT
jgi:hypothetical protein